MKLEFWTPLYRTPEEYLNLDTRSTEILVPKQEYRAEKLRTNLSMLAVTQISTSADSLIV